MLSLSPKFLLFPLASELTRSLFVAPFWCTAVWSCAIVQPFRFGLIRLVIVLLGLSVLGLGRSYSILQFTFPFLIASAICIPPRHGFDVHGFFWNVVVRAFASLLTASIEIATAPIAIFAPYFFLDFHTREYKELIVPTLTASLMACFCSGDRFTP